MTDVAANFATITAALEDMHAVAVEGHARGASIDEHFALLSALQGGVENLARMIADTRREIVNLMPGSYNGFTAAERQAGGAAIRAALADGRLSYSSACSVCGCSLTAPHQMHLERYDQPLSVYPVCRRCHHAVHIRFRLPSFWRRFIAGLPVKCWVHELPDPEAAMADLRLFK